MHQVQFIHQAAGLEQLERAVDGDAVDLGILFAGELEEPLGVQVLAGLIDQIEQNLRCRVSLTPCCLSESLIPETAMRLPLRVANGQEGRLIVTLPCGRSSVGYAVHVKT